MQKKLFMQLRASLRDFFVCERRMKDEVIDSVIKSTKEEGGIYFKRFYMEYTVNIFNFFKMYFR